MQIWNIPEKNRALNQGSLLCSQPTSSSSIGWYLMCQAIRYRLFSVYFLLYLHNIYYFFYFDILLPWFVNWQFLSLLVFWIYLSLLVFDNICHHFSHSQVYAGDENYEYVPPFSFKLDSNNQLVSNRTLSSWIFCLKIHLSQVDDGSPLHAILFLVYKQSGRCSKISFNHYLNNNTLYQLRVEITEGQNGCNPELGSRVGNKDALASK